jgi:GMP synthase-like glutamine amidotransferase
VAVLIIKNIITEGPGTIEDFLRKEDFSFKVVELSSGEVPPSLEDFNSLVIMGGPMGVYDIGRYPHLRIESRIIREAINRDMKVLGICLGAQMIAYCLGSDVYKGPEEEIGWQHIELAGDGIRDPFMKKLAIHPSVGDFWRKFKVFHWHGDTFEIPIGAMLLASSELYKNQAFRYKNNVYGFQFHIEVTKKMIKDWFENRPEADSIVKETDGIYEEYSGRARNFYKEFFQK